MGEFRNYPSGIPACAAAFFGGNADADLLVYAAEADAPQHACSRALTSATGDPRHQIEFIAGRRGLGTHRVIVYLPLP